MFERCIIKYKLEFRLRVAYDFCTISESILPDRCFPISTAYELKSMFNPAIRSRKPTHIKRGRCLTLDLPQIGRPIRRRRSTTASDYTFSAISWQSSFMTGTDMHLQRRTSSGFRSIALSTAGRRTSRKSSWLT